VKRGLALLAGLTLLVGCHHESKVALKPAPAPPRERTLQSAPEAKPVVQVLGTDPSGCTWIGSEGLVTVGEQDSRYQARAAAISEARKSAMQDYLGVGVQTRFMDFEQDGLRGHEQLVENILKTTRQGRILKEDILSEGYQDAGDCYACRYHVQIKPCLAPLPKTHDPDFQATLALSQTHFVDGNEAKVSVSASQDCYVYLYDVGMDWSTSLLVPNSAVPEVHLKAGDIFVYPDEALSKSGVHLVAQIPEGQDVSAETIRLVATKTPLTRDEQDPAMGGYLSLMRRLNASDVDWADDAQAFTIYRR
jgi:hypothetical protein